MKSAGLLKREHFTTQHVLELCKSWPWDIMETNITNGFKTWWGNLQGIGPSVSAQNCVQDETPEVSMSTEAVREGRSLSACTASHVLHLSVPFWPHSGHGARWGFPLRCDNSVLLLCFKNLYPIYLFLFLCFSTSSITVSTGRPRCISVFAPCSSSKWQRSSPLPFHRRIVDPGRICWDGKGPEGLTATFLLLTLCVVPQNRAMQTLPCQHFSLQPWAASSSYE